MDVSNIKSAEDAVNWYESMNFDEFSEFRDQLDTESDRGCALMTAAFLDELLKRLLRKYLVDNADSFNQLFTGTGGLSSFSARIEMCYLLGLISDRARRDLNIIRKIRNDFAHLMDKIDFNNETVANRCRSLHDFGFKELKPRSAFTRVSFAIGGLIHGATRKAEHKTPHENYDFTSEESIKQLIAISKLKQEIELYKELHGWSDLNK